MQLKPVLWDQGQKYNSTREQGREGEINTIPTSCQHKWLGKPALETPVEQPTIHPLVTYASLPEWLTSSAEVPEDGTAVRGNLQVGGEGAQGRQHILNPAFSSQHFCC